MTNLNVSFDVLVVWVVVVVWAVSGAGGAGISGACSSASAIIYFFWFHCGTQGNLVDLRPVPLSIWVL